MNIELIDRWKDAYKFISVILTFLTGLVDIVYAALPQFQTALSPTQFASFNAIMGIAIIVARIVKQAFPVTEEVKAKMIETAVDNPTHEAAPDHAP